LIKNPIDSDRFADLAHLKAIEQAGTFKNQKIAIAPIRSTTTTQVEGDPLLSKDIRFLFEPNSSKLDMASADNTKNLDLIKKLLQVSPGSTIVLRGHVDPSRVPELKKMGGDQMVRQYALRAMALSKDRAESVRKVLIANLKVDTDRIDSVGRGWEEPIGTDGEQNRRVEVQWFTLE
jgi:NitT/TauT family transport system substrate-binding protein